MIIVLIFTLLTSPLTDYVTGTVLKAFEELWRKTGDKRYSQYIQKTVDNVVNSDGTITDSKLSDYNVEKKEQDWADPATGLSAIFWGRAMGWYAMAPVDVLDYLQPEHSGRNDLIAILQRLAEAISKVQDDSTGVWWQVMDQPYREGNYLEASVSCMFVYALAKGIRLGYLDAKFKAVVEKAYQGILKEFISENADGTIDLNQICRSAGLGYERDDSYEYYVYQEKKVSNDGKGVGPFITANLEMEMMEKH